MTVDDSGSGAGAPGTAGGAPGSGAEPAARGGGPDGGQRPGAGQHTEDRQGGDRQDQDPSPRQGDGAHHTDGPRPERDGRAGEGGAPDGPRPGGARRAPGPFDPGAGAGAEPASGEDAAAGDGSERERTSEGDNPLAIRIEQLILGAERRYTPFQAARTAGVPMELASRFWRAMGFADIGQAKALTEADVLALRRLAGLVEAGLLSEAMAVQVARSTGQTTARLAEWQIDSFLEGLTEPPEPGMSRSEVAYPLVELLLPELEEFLVYVWRRQLAAATSRVVQAGDDDEMVDRRLAVGFADLVGFTRLTRRLEEEELGELVEAFETTAADLVAARGGRLIKTLGDEVLFAADDASTAAEIGVLLIETLEKDPTMPGIRVGIAFGTVTTRMGDVFGTTVNLASRLTSIAPRNAVLVDGSFRDELTASGAAPVSEKETEQDPEGEKHGGYRFALRPLYQRPVRGLGVVEPWQLTRRRPANS